MTSTTTEATTTGQRVYVRRLGYGTLQQVHEDHSVTVRLENGGTEERVPFGDWAHDRTGPDAETSSVELGARIRTALRLDFGDDFAEVSSGLRGLGWWTSARYGRYLVHIQVTPED
jgi:hypothetical protein